MKTSKYEEPKIWWLLLPFKIYVVTATPFYFLWRIFYPQPLFVHIGNNITVADSLAEIMLEIFAISGPILFIGALIQLFSNARKAGFHTLLYAAIPTLIFIGWFLLWGVEHLL